MEQTVGIFESFLNAAAEITSQFGTVLVNAAQSVGGILYDTTAGELTIVGGAMALALGIGVVYLLFRMVRGLIKQNNRG